MAVKLEFETVLFYGCPRLPGVIGGSTWVEQGGYKEEFVNGIKPGLFDPTAEDLYNTYCLGRSLSLWYDAKEPIKKEIILLLKAFQERLEAGTLPDPGSLKFYKPKGA